MLHLEGSGMPVLYIGRTVLKGQLSCVRRYIFCNLYTYVTILFFKPVFNLYNVPKLSSSLSVNTLSITKAELLRFYYQGERSKSGHLLAS